MRSRATTLHCPATDLSFERLICAEQELLPGLSTRVEGARHLGSPERPIRQQAAVFPRKGDSLRDALVDDIDADLGKPVDVRLARAEIASLDRVVEQPKDRVAVVRVVLRGVDAALRRNAVGAARGIVVRNVDDPIPQLAERGGGRRARESSSDDDHGVFPLVRRTDQLHLELVPLPLGLERARRDARIQRRRAAHRIHPANTATGMSANPTATATATTTATGRWKGCGVGRATPSVRAELQTP